MANLRALRTYFDEFGLRSDVFELADPAWREDYAIPMNTLQGYVTLDEAQDPERLQQRAGCHGAPRVPHTRTSAPHGASC